MGKIFIYNETYPLFGKMYQMTKLEKHKCQGVKDCEIKIKHDVETYMKEYGKKVGTKIEEESGFLSRPTVNISFKGKINYLKLTIIIGIVVLGIYSVWRKNFAVGVVASIGLLLVLAKPALLTTPSKQDDYGMPDIPPEG